MANFSIHTRLVFFAVILVTVTTAGIATVTERVATTQLKKRIGEELAERSMALADKIDRLMAERYIDIRLHADLFRDPAFLDTPERIRARLNVLHDAYQGYAWIGYADVSGNVIAATGGLLEGVNVSQRPWYGQASKAAFVGDPHRAVLLEKKLNAGGSEPLRFLDVAMPVLGSDGSFKGVLGAHIDWRWIDEISESMPHKTKSEVLLLATNDTVLHGPRELQDNVVVLESAQAARSGTPGYRIERWPDGKTYLTGYSQSRGHGQYPGLGWVVLDRQEISEAFVPAMKLRHQFFLWGAAIAFLAALLGWFVAVRISRPLIEITRAAETLQHRDATMEIPLVKGYREVVVLARTLRDLIAELGRREAQLPNRMLIKALLDQTILATHREKRGIAVFTIGLDRFKTINDTRGRETGDLVLRTVSERLGACMRGNGTLGHLSNDEFFMIMEKADMKTTDIAVAAARMRDAVRQPFHNGSTEFFLTASVGASLYPKDGNDAETLLRFSEVALHQAKAQGGDCILSYDTQMNTALLERLELERELRHAIEKNQLELHYQPQLSLLNGAIVGVEALLRWRHPELGVISPAKFIPVAEASGLIVPIGDWVMRTACAQASTWRKAGLPSVRMSVNVSVQQFAERELIERVFEALTLHDLAPELLQLEITESMLMQEVDRSIETMQELASLCVQIAIDDFGTGYSSLSYLKQFPLSELKIDQSFIRELTSHSDDAAIVRAVIALGHNLGLSVIAEGVETVEQMRFLRHAGCDEIQGYHFSRPLPAADLGNLLRTHGSMVQISVADGMADLSGQRIAE